LVAFVSWQVLDGGGQAPWSEVFAELPDCSPHFRMLWLVLIQVSNAVPLAVACAMLPQVGVT
jgi:hypothetical protein